MNCDTKNISRYHDGEMTPEERVRFESHLARCAACSVAVGRVRRVARFVSAAGGAELDRRRLDSIHALITRQSLLRFAQTILAVAAAVFLVSGLFLMKNDDSPDSGASGWERVAVTEKSDPPPLENADPVVQVLLRDQQ